MQPKIEFRVKRAGKLNNYQMEKEFKTLARNELAKVLSKGVFSTANKRIARLKSSGVVSQALETIKEKGYEKFSVAGKDLKQLWHDYHMCISFLNMKTSSVTGARIVEDNLTRKLGGRKMTTDQKKKVFEVFRKVGRLSPAGVNAYGSDRLIQMIYDELEEFDESEDGEDFQTLIDKAWNETSKALEERETEFYNRTRDRFSI